MPANRFLKRSILLSLLLALVLLAGCGPQLSGKYTDDSGIIEYDFKDDKVYAGSLGFIAALDYSIDGDKVLIGPEGQQQILTLEDDGTLTGPMGIKIRKVE